MPVPSSSQPGASDLSEAARVRLDALRRDLLREAGVAEETPAEPAAAADPGVAEPTMPRPGRHASRRPRGRGLMLGLLERLPPSLADRPLGAPHVAVVAVCAMVLVTAGAWWALQLRGDRPDIAIAAPAEGGGAVAGDDGLASPAAPEPSAAPLTPLVPAGAEAASSTGEQAVVVVDVAGRVRRPGLATLPDGSRVADAIEAAGGARRGVRLVSLNLARVLVDGEQVLVGVRAVPGAVPSTVTTPPAADEAGPLVNLNTADEAGLETLPGVGPVTAAAIVAWRTEHGGFTSVEELIEVSGIGPATLEELLPHVTV